MNLNEGQKKAVHHFKGACMCLAGPGSGKTTVIVERTRYLIEECGVAPEKILVITFTKAAANEMKSRFLNRMNGKGTGVQFGTFHAIFFTILKHAYHYNVNNIIRPSEKKQCLAEIISGLELEIQNENEFIMDMESEISMVKGQRISIDNYYSANVSKEQFQYIFKKYQAYLARKQLLDFDDMLVYCYELLSEREDILKGWQNQFEYILIDEFQDISSLQYDIIKMLARPQNNLFIVGDDDQSIYRFRGARPEIMLHFPEDFENVKIVQLDVNYRCTKGITHIAGRLIGNNKKRFTKNIFANNESAEGVTVRSFENVVFQNLKILEEIQRDYEKGIPYREMAVLVRTNTGARRITGLLSRYQIPFRVKDQMPNVFEHWIARNILTYIKIARGSKERSLYLQIANRPVRYINREAFDSKYVDLERVMTYYEDKPWMVERIEEFAYELEMLGDMMPYAAVNYILRGIGYEEYLENYGKEHGIDSNELLQIAEEVKDSAKDFKTYEEWFAFMEEYKEKLNAQYKQQEEEMEAVQILTMHESKGLEFEVVYIPDANEGVIPHGKAVLDADLEEERRMFYVAMTRARTHLRISYVKERFHKKADASRFVEEIVGEKERNA